MAILYGFAARFLFGVVFLHKAKEGRWLCAVSTHNLLPHQRTAHWFTMKAPNPFRPSESLISSPRHGHCVCAHSHLPCFALCRKTTPNKQRAAKKKNGHELSPGYTEKATTGPVLRKYNLFLYSCLYFYAFFVKLTTVLNFSYKVFKSFVICKTRLAVIYAPSLGCLWQGQQCKFSN